MMTADLIERFSQAHKEFISYINALGSDAFIHSEQGKWTAGQQILHVILCLQPISQALNSKPFIEQKFGLVNRPILNRAEVINLYISALNQGGKAPERFVPPGVGQESRKGLSEDLEALLQTLSTQLVGYSDHELDTLVLPHPLLGKLTIREMFFLMTYHATHHLEQIKNNLIGLRMPVRGHTIA